MSSLDEEVTVWLEIGGGVGEELLRWQNGGTFHKSALMDSTAVVEVGAVVHEKGILGADVHVGSGTVIGPSVAIGHSTKIGYNVSLSNCSVGDSCAVHCRVCIGQDGFGSYVDEHGSMVKKPQTLNVRIGNCVEIGANTCIDRGSWRDTEIGDGTKIDNLVQIGHNVIIGKSCLLCGQVGIAGSVTMGDCITLGGRVAIRDHAFIVSKTCYLQCWRETLKDSKLWVQKQECATQFQQPVPTTTVFFMHNTSGHETSSSFQSEPGTSNMGSSENCPSSLNEVSTIEL